MRRWTIVSKESKKVHVTFGDSKRIMRYEKGAGVKELRPLFLSEFSDVLPDDISPANVKFQVLDGTFKDYVDLANEQQLEENAKIKAITVVTKENQVSYMAINSLRNLVSQGFPCRASIKCSIHLLYGW